MKTFEEENSQTNQKLFFEEVNPSLFQEAKNY
jgi:hypothetical protein